MEFVRTPGTLKKAALSAFHGVRENSGNIIKKNNLISVHGDDLK